jgi:thiol:disulfide interchange protein
MFAALERLKHRIHNTRIPIKNPRVLFLVQCLYFVAPIVAGETLMPYIIPNPEEMRSRIPKPSEEDLNAIAAEKRRLQQQLDEARARRLRS